jgi:hypothetical protein
MKRAFRYLRIAFSATCLIACVLFIVLWVRSYWWCDDIVGPVGTTQSFCIWSDVGQVGFSLVDHRLKSLADGGPWVFASEWTGNLPPRSRIDIPFLPSWATEHDVVIRDWCLVLLMGASVAAPWCHWRFSLRTLLIAMTLVAVVLGLVVWSMRAR